MNDSLLDTVTISELRKNRQANPSVLAWQHQCRDRAFWLSVITIMEIRTGLLQVRPRDPEEMYGYLSISVVPEARRHPGTQHSRPRKFLIHLFRVPSRL